MALSHPRARRGCAGQSCPHVTPTPGQPEARPAPLSCGGSQGGRLPSGRQQRVHARPAQASGLNRGVAAVTAT